MQGWKFTDIYFLKKYKICENVSFPGRINCCDFAKTDLWKNAQNIRIEHIKRYENLEKNKISCFLYKNCICDQ